MRIDEEAGGYEAISYVWGNTMKSRRIVCDGAEMFITESLFDALMRLRHLHRQRRLWADQICIDQDSLEEKAIQIPIMNVIYRNADHVLVWLGGDESGVAKEACDLIKDLAATFSAERTRDGSGHKSSDNLCHLPVSQEAWSPLRTLTELAWVSIKVDPNPTKLLSRSIIVYPGVGSPRGGHKCARDSLLGWLTDRVGTPVLGLRGTNRSSPST